MKIPIDRITESPESWSFEATPDWWRERCDAEVREAVAEPLGVTARAHRMADDLYLEGEVQGGLSFVCGRCLTRYRAPVRESFRLVLEPAGSRVPADPEGAATLVREGLVLGDELESGWFGGTELGLDSFVAELLMLGLPVQPLCREDCKGLCPRCGVDRNTESCDCQEPRPASPFAVLEALRDRDQETT